MDMVMDTMDAIVMEDMEDMVVMADIDLSLIHISITGDKDITTNVNKDGKGEFTPTSSNKKYDVNYEGTTTDKGNFAGKITVLTYEATNKVYVFDYGLESNIADTTTGDGLFQGGIFYNEKATGTMATTAKLGEITPAQENSQTTISRCV